MGCLAPIVTRLSPAGISKREREARRPSGSFHRQVPVILAGTTKKWRSCPSTARMSFPVNIMAVETIRAWFRPSGFAAVLY
jgi:hypothetical protein